MMRLRRRVRYHAMGAALVLSVACTRPSNLPVVQSSDVITRDELSRTTALNAYEAVERLRPQFLKDRGRTSLLQQGSRTPIVVLDDRPLGDMSALRDISISTAMSGNGSSGRSGSRPSSRASLVGSK